jgi:hypothetical protein
MALEMRRSDPPESGFSENAQLPAPRTFLEALIRGRRLAFACLEGEGGRISVNSIAEQEDGRIEFVGRAAFVPGSVQPIFGEEPVSEERQNAISIGLLLVEKFLCIINQPGLTELRPRNTDKRVMRQAAVGSIEAPRPKWHECHIRPGVHGIASSGVGEHREHQLHYVRKHRKPSLGPDRWIDGYWRGNADLGIHLKSYVAHPPKGRVL